MHTDLVLTARLMKRFFQSPLSQPPSVNDEIRSLGSFGNSLEQLDTLVFAIGETQNNGTRLAFSVGADLDPPRLGRDAPGTAVLRSSGRYRLSLSPSMTVIGTAVTRAALGVARGGEADAGLEVLDLGAGILEDLLTVDLSLSATDKVTLLASTDGLGVDILGVPAGFGGDPASFDLSNGLSVNTEEAIRSSAVFDSDGVAEPVILDVYLINAGVAQFIGQLGASGGIVDFDDDQIADGLDNCQLVANADQRDTNGDGFGNICDADLDNDGVVNFVDLAIMKSVFFTSAPDADLDGDGTVNFTDLAILKSVFFLPPGPSGIV